MIPFDTASKNNKEENWIPSSILFCSVLHHHIYHPQIAPRIHTCIILESRSVIHIAEPKCIIDSSHLRKIHNTTKSYEACSKQSRLSSMQPNRIFFQTFKVYVKDSDLYFHPERSSSNSRRSRDVLFLHLTNLQHTTSTSSIRNQNDAYRLLLVNNLDRFKFILTLHPIIATRLKFSQLLLFLLAFLVLNHMLLSIFVHQPIQPLSPQQQRHILPPNTLPLSPSPLFRRSITIQTAQRAILLLLRR